MVGARGVGGEEGGEVEGVGVGGSVGGSHEMEDGGSPVHSRISLMNSQSMSVVVSWNVMFRCVILVCDTVKVFLDSVLSLEGKEHLSNLTVFVLKLIVGEPILAEGILNV